jgi:HEPN domain-containing protein
MGEKRVTEARRWFLQASHDLNAVGWNIQGGFHSTACFLAQQAGEKGLKSLLYFLGGRRSALLTHSLVEMVQEAAARVGGIAEALEDARSLDLHYIPSRYPNGLPSGYPHRFYAKETAERALRAAEHILGFVRAYYEAEGAQVILQEEQP